MKEKKKIAIEAFEKNSQSFYREIRKKLREDEIALNETTLITIVVNYEIDLIPYFAFKIESERESYYSDYYPPNFIRERKNNLDLNCTEDIEIIVLYGHEIPVQRLN